MKVLRWLGVLLSYPLGLAAGWGVSQWIVAIADDRCPSVSQVGGACVAAWHTDWVTASVYIGIGVATALLTLLPAALAPALRWPAATLGLLLAVAVPGGLYLFSGWSELLQPALFAALLGALLVGWFLRHGGSANA